MTLYETRQGDVLDEILWRIHGTVDVGMVEATLEANRGLADHGPVFGSGIVIQIPDRQTSAPKQLISLWQ